MSRKNRRVSDYVPLDLTPESLAPAPRKPGQPYPPRWQVERDRAERQREARARQGIDWSVCIVPGCGESLILWGTVLHRSRRRDPSTELPICDTHAAIVWNQLVEFHTKRDRFIEAIADVNARLAARTQREHEDAKATRLASEDGCVYFVRVGELIKVGWTRDLLKRFKSYGASAELLACYPGRREDETHLHRQLTPARAKGREWYRDEQIVRDFIASTIDEWGDPPSMDGLWTAPARVVAGKRAARYR